MKLRISFDYGADCLWLSGEDVPIAKPVYVNSDGYFACNYGECDWKYPEERLKGQYELESKVNYINKEYPKLFINNEIEFSYKGFDSEEDERVFDEAVKFVYEKLYDLLSDDYEIVNDTVIEF